AEPTRGKHGVYRWVDVTFPPATLPRAVCDFLHAARYKGEEQTPEKTRQASRVHSSSETPREFDPDQEKYFQDVAKGKSRHKRLFKIAVAIKRQTGVGAAEIAKALNFHASRFSNPLNDPAWIDRVAATIGGGA